MRKLRKSDGIKVKSARVRTLAETDVVARDMKAAYKRFATSTGYKGGR